MAEIIAKIVEAAADVVKEVVSAARKGAELPQAKGRGAVVDKGSDLNQLKIHGPTRTELYHAFSYAQLPFIINQQQKEEEEEDKEETETGRGDLLELELKSHLSQLKTPGLSLKKKKDYGKRKQDMKQNRNVSAEIYDLIRSILHIFPWFYNFLKGVIIIRSTKQS